MVWSVCPYLLIPNFAAAHERLSPEGSLPGDRRSTQAGGAAQAVADAGVCGAQVLRLILLANPASHALRAEVGTRVIYLLLFLNHK
jgi:hypothetical protein